MATISIEQARTKLRQLIDQVNEERNPITIVGDAGKNAVIVPEEDWLGLMATIELGENQKFIKNVQEICMAEDWKSDREYIPGEEW